MLRGGLGRRECSLQRRCRRAVLRNHRLFVLLLLLFCFSFKNVKTKGNSFRNNIFKLLLQNSIYLQGDLKLEATAPRITVRPAGVRFEATSWNDDWSLNLAPLDPLAPLPHERTPSTDLNDVKETSMFCYFYVILNVNYSVDVPTTNGIYKRAPHPAEAYSMSWMEASCYAFLRRQGAPSPNLTLQRGWWWPWPKAETTHLSPGRRLWRKGLSFCRLPDEGAPPRAASVSAPLLTTHHWKRVTLPGAFLTSEVEAIKTCLHSW